jgi:hypothetical protein
MTTQNLDIEKKGLRGLVTWLEEKGHRVEPSDNKVFDLIVDDEYVEVKTKKGTWDKFDFLGLTQNQYAALKAGELKKIYLVLNANEPENIDVKIINGHDLLGAKHIVEKTYYWYKSSVREIIE